MTHSKEEIIKALTVIATTCNESACDGCPFSDRYGDCMITKDRVIPQNWDINENEVWKALR